jgi:hypothetical protein
VPVKFVPVIITDVPLLPKVGVNDVITGTGFVGVIIGVDELSDFEHFKKKKIIKIRNEYFFILCFLY